MVGPTKTFSKRELYWKKLLDFCDTRLSEVLNVQNVAEESLNINTT